MIESGIYTYITTNAPLQVLLGQSLQEKTTGSFTAMYFSFLPKEPTLPGIVVDRLQSAEEDDTLDPRTSMPGAMLEAKFQFGCIAQDARTNPANFSGYLSAAQLAQQLRYQLMALATGVAVLPDGSAVKDVRIDDEFDAHFEIGGAGYVYRRMLIVTIFYVEGGSAPAPTGGSLTRYSFTPSPNGVQTAFTAPVAISANALVVRNGNIQSTPADYTYAGAVVSWNVAPGSGDILALYQ